MAGNELFFDPLENGEDRQDEGHEPAPEATHSRAVEDPAHRRSLEMQHVRDELEKMVRAGKRS